MKKFFAFFAAMLFAGGMMADSYVKVTSAPADWSGDYLIVYETNNVAFNGGLETLDAVENTIAVTIAEGAIEANAATDAAKFTIAAMEGGYSIQAASGKFIAQNSYANGLKSLDAAVAHSLAIDADGNAELAVSVDNSGTPANVTLRYNDASNQLRFRYYKSGQKAIQLYKREGGSVTPPEPQGCNWDEIAFLGNGSGNAAYTDRFKVCAGDPAPTSIVNIQAPDWATEPGIYVTFPSAAFGAISLDASQYAIDGAGMVLYVSAFLYDAEKEVTIVCQDVTYTLTVKNANPEVAPVEPISCLEVYQLAKNDVVGLLNPVTVTYSNGANVWVMDGSASMLIYLPSGFTNNFQAGDTLSGISGVVDIYQNIVYEVKPDATQAAAIVATPGEAPAPSQAAVIEASDVNKYVILPGFSIEGEFTTASKTSLPAVLGEDTVTIYNNFKFAYTFEAGKTYDIIGVVSAYKGNPQVYFISATEVEDTPILGVETIYDWAGEIGTTIFGGNSNITTGTVKIHENTDEVNGIKFGSSYVYADGKYIAIKPAEGGFKAGDVLSVSVVFNNSDATKYCMVDLRAADGDTRIWMSDSLSTLNGRNAGEPIVQTYTLAADQDSLFLGRYGNTGMFITLLKVERALVPPTPQPTVNYYVAGSMNNWGPAEAYMLTPNNASLYEGEFTFAANDEFKVIGFDGENTTWYPDGMGNNFQITEAGDYKITFNPAGNVEGWYAGFFNVVKKEAPIVHQYEVAEAIAAGLTDDTEILVRGIITKMEFKGKNFAKYGSVNIYVADATGAEGEFEFFNCYSLDADTFRTSTPAYDAESTAWAQFNEVVDGNGNAIHVGDTVIAFGKYKLYNSTHELNTGCYLVDIKHAPQVPAEDINVNMSEGLVFNDYVAAAGWWQIYGDNEQYSVSISNVATTQAEGTYTIADLDLDYTYIGVINGTDTTYISFVDGSVTLSISAEGDVTVAGTLVGEDGNNYILNLVFVCPKPTVTVDVNIAEGMLDDVYAAYGLYTVAGMDENSILVQFSIWAMQGFQGDFDETDLDYVNVGSGIMDGDEMVEIYKAAITVTPGNGGDYTVTATVLGYNNKQYNITMYIPATEGIEDVEAVVKAIKSIVNGQVVVEKAGKTFNMNGQVIR